ncbi:MAG TPA: hypothetical protein VGM89_18790 [Puia sp.]
MGKIRVGRRLVKTVAQVCLFLLPAVYLLFSLFLLAFIRGWDYDRLIQWYSVKWPMAFDEGTVASTCFTPAWYGFVKSWSTAAIAALLGVLVLYILFRGRVWRFCGRCCSEAGIALRAMGAVYRGLSGWEKGLLLGLFGAILLYRGYFFFAFPLHTDELASYLFFVRSGPLIAVTSYPLPNNHILFNGFCSLIALVPGLPIKLVMRLPSIAGDVFVLYALFSLFTRWDGFWRGFFVVAGVAFCYFTSYYAMQGRGYEWQVGFALIGLVSGLECFVWARARRGFGWFVLSSVAGFYLNPTFVYAFLALVFFLGYWLWRNRDWSGFLLFVRGGVLIVGLGVLLYLPVIVASGWHALTANEYVTGFTSYRELAAHFSSFTYLLKDGSYYGRAGMYFGLAFFAACFVFYRRGWIGGGLYAYSAGYLLAVGGSLVVLIGYSRMYPLERGLCYWILGANVLFVNIIYDLVRRWGSAKRVLPVMVLFLLVKIGGSLRGLVLQRWSSGQRKEVVLYRAIREDLERLGGLHPASWQIMYPDDFYPMYLREYLIEGVGGRVERRGDSAVMFDRRAARGEVLFLPDHYRDGFDLRGYTLWGEGRVTVIGDLPADKLLSIYVRK